MSPINSKTAAQRIAQILRERSSKLADQVEGIKELTALPLQTREEVIDELTSELAAKGLGHGSEPNRYGLELEDLIDACCVVRSEDEASKE